jgi:aspartokinase/homoserine dehydrogenase 1
MKIMKFGGSSVGNAGRIIKAMKIVQEAFSHEQKGAVVFSAYQGITDQLIRVGEMAAQSDQAYLALFNEIQERHLDTARELISIQTQSNILAEIKFMLRQLEEVLHGIYLIKELSAKSLDYIMSFGERLSAFTISEGLKDRGFNNQFLDTRSVIKTDHHFGRAKVDFNATDQNLQRLFNNAPVVQIVTGFIASSQQDETTTLGRGGSDFTASIIGAALDADEIEIWTDVDGVLTADPRKVPVAFSIPEMTYEEAMELSHFGAKVIYPPTMQPALDKKIPLIIKNSMNPAFPGTVVSEKSYKNPYQITGISSIDEIALLTIQGSGMIGVAGIAQRIFGALAQKKISIIMITQASSEHSICLAILPQFKDLAVEALQEELKYEIRDEIISEIKVETQLSVVAVVGENMRQRKGLAGQVFKALGDHGINISAIAQGSSERNISVVVARDDEVRALNAVHAAFFSKSAKPVYLYLVGAGLIGGTFLDQLQRQQKQMIETQAVNLILAAIADIDHMYFDRNGVDLTAWRELLKSSGTATNIDNFIQMIKSDAFPNRIFIDCTASELISQKYLEILSAKICIVTSNKKANSGRYYFYRELQQAALDQRCRYLYETNVGAGLPVIAAIQNLLLAGDVIHKIEGVLSGTLSYIFNTLSPQKAFSEVVREAHQKGFTEPDPREDLNGMDIARKILILARELGVQLELEDIKIEKALPREAEAVQSPEEFFTILEKYDDAMKEKFVAADRTHRRLRYVAKFEKGKAVVALKSVHSSHPFYNLEGSDNIIAIYSRYYETPLVIKGPGAGANVTAAGVFADVLKAALRLS